MDSVRLKNGNYYLRRVPDGAGTQGPILESYKWSDGTDRTYVNESKAIGSPGEIYVGCRIICATHYPEKYLSDFWLTSNVKEILSVQYDQFDLAIKVKFRTLNSIYEAGTFEVPPQILN